MPEKIEESRLRELSREIGDPGLFPVEVHRLFEAGKARKAQAVLRGHIPKENNSARRRRLEEYVDDPYMWLEPIKKAPSLHTVNGIGSMLYGRYKPDPGSGLYIATLWFVFVFLPVFPIAAYLVRKGSGNSWTFYAKASLPPFARIWRLGFAAVVVAAVVGVGALVAWDSSHAEVAVYNGYQVPMSVQVGEDRLRVGPHQLVSAGAHPLGDLPLSARPDGWEQPLEVFEAELSASRCDPLLYNIGGRAVVMRSWVVYGPGDPPEEVLVGPERVINFDDPDYLFRDPPISKSVSEGSSIIDEVVYNAEDEVDFTTVAMYLEAFEGPEVAWQLVRAELLVNPGNHDAQALMGRFYGVGSPELNELGATARELHPASVEAHRLYQSVVAAEQLDSVRDEYLALARDRSGSALHQYLAGRLLVDGSDEAELAFREALNLDPEFSYAHLGLGYALGLRGEYSEALEHYAAYADSSDRAFEQTLRPRIRLMKVAGLPAWREAADQLLATGLGKTHNHYPLINLRSCLQTWYQPGSLPQVLEGLPSALIPDDVDPVELQSALGAAALDAALAAGDLEQVGSVLAGLDPEYDTLTLAHGQLYLALATGDVELMRASFDEQAEAWELASGSLALLAAAAASALDHESAEALTLAAGEGRLGGSTNPSVVLEPGAAIDTPEALDALLAPVSLDARGFGYAAAAILLEHDSGGSSASARHAREQALALLLPDETPRWQ